MVTGVNSHVDTISLYIVSVSFISRCVRCWCQLLKKWRKQPLLHPMSHQPPGSSKDHPSGKHHASQSGHYVLQLCHHRMWEGLPVAGHCSGWFSWKPDLTAKLQDSRSVMMTSFGTVLRRHWQQIFFQSLSWIHDSWSISWGTCLLLGECHSWFAACFGLITSPDLKERTLGPNETQYNPIIRTVNPSHFAQNAEWLSFATSQFPCPGDLGSGWLGVLGRRTAEEIAMQLTNMTNEYNDRL